MTGEVGRRMTEVKARMTALEERPMIFGPAEREIAGIQIETPR
jgi:hypothetical protein